MQHVKGKRFFDSSSKSLDNAYNDEDGVTVEGNTMYIAGTRFDPPKNIWGVLDIPRRIRQLEVPQDVLDDIKIPLGLTRYSQRYEDASAVLEANPQVNRVVSHSLGSAVGTELQQRHPERNIQAIGFGSPFFQYNKSKPSPHNIRFRHPYDPISMLDKGAITKPKTSGSKLNVLGNHSFSKFA